MGETLPALEFGHFTSSFGEEGVKWQREFLEGRADEPSARSVECVLRELPAESFRQSEKVFAPIRWRDGALPPCVKGREIVVSTAVKLLLENLPLALQSQRESMAQCLEAMGRVALVRAVYLFGSHARGDARPDSDVDLCIVADGAERQLETAAQFREAIWDVWPRPAFTLVPIAPARLAEKQARRDHFFATVLKEGVLIATEN